MQELVFLQITFGKCTISFYFGNGEVAITFVALISIKRFHMFTHFYAVSFSAKTCFMKITTKFNSSTTRIFAKLLVVSES